MKKREYEETKEVIDDMINIKEYKVCLEVVDDFMEQLEKENTPYKNDYIYFCFYTRAKCYQHLEDKDNMLKSMQDLTECTMRYKIQDGDEMAKQWWGFAYVLKRVGDIKKSIYYLNKCETHYIETNNKYFLARILNMKGFYLKDEKLIKQAINTLIEAKLHIEKINDLDNFYDSLVTIYIENHNYMKAKDIIANKINNKDVKEKLMQGLKDELKQHKDKVISIC